MVKKKGVRFQYEGIYYIKDIKTKELYDMKTHELKYTPIGGRDSGRYAEVIYYDSEDESDDSEDELLEAIKKRDLEEIAREIDEARVIDESDDESEDEDLYIPEDKRDAGDIAFAKIFAEMGISNPRYVRGIEKETPKKISKADVKREFSK